MTRAISVAELGDRLRKDLDTPRWSYKRGHYWVTAKVRERFGCTPYFRELNISARPELVEVWPDQFSSCSLFSRFVVQITYKLEGATPLGKFLAHAKAFCQVRKNREVVTRQTDRFNCLLHCNDKT